MTSEACKNLPVVVPKHYTLSGSYTKLAGLDVYVTGSSTAKAGIIDVYDIFGMAPQTLQGADMLAAGLDALVLVPDFFKGSPAQHEWVPPDTPEKQKLLAKFVEERADVSTGAKTLATLAKEAKTTYPSVLSWGSFGLCWGGKVVVLASGEDTPFVASSQVHPGRMEAADADKLTIPHAVLASKDEPADVVAHYAKVVPHAKGGVVETYGTMHHGWMGARANLEDNANSKEFQRGYGALADFFQKHLTA